MCVSEKVSRWRERSEEGRGGKKEKSMLCNKILQVWSPGSQEPCKVDWEDQNKIKKKRWEGRRRRDGTEEVSDITVPLGEEGVEERRRAMTD